MSPSPVRDAPSRPQPTVLVLGRDAVGMALLAALIETLGYPVRFAGPLEAPDEALRRVRPRICLVDCTQPDLCTDEFLGRAAMRGVAVVVFGATDALGRIRDTIDTHRLGRLLLPPDVQELSQIFERALLD